MEEDSSRSPSSKVQAKTFLHFVLSCSVFFPLRALISSISGAELEVAATQTLEFVDEVFCAVGVPVLQGVLSAGSKQFASSALLRRTCLSQTEQSGKSAPLGAKTGTKTTSTARKIASVSKSGENAIPGTGAKRTLHPKNRYNLVLHSFSA
jgi:hypothetical protein